ncbi:MAG: TatD family hydrolase [Gammaproteobacteria bacterium]|nr:TatD family hydrolase [Pseudomonadales bacterium]MCP5346079.1 TatD family hydrolase [Pseudomonadales bacterium]
MNTSIPPLIDIGANLAHSSFSHDLDQVLEQSRAAGIGHIIVTGTDLESVAAALTLSREHAGYLTLTAGFHPHVASTFDAEAGRQIEHYARLPEVVAVGETGLDFNRDYSPRDQQEDAFARQLELAGKVQKPVFLHQRDAHDSFQRILREYRSHLTGGVVHCFTDTREALFDYLDLDMYIGVTGWICDERRGRALQDLVSEIPADRLLLETDAPYLLPRSLRPAPSSRRNEPRYLVEVLETVARCRGESAEQVAQHTSANARRLFGVTGAAA